MHRANSDFKSYILGVSDGIVKTPQWAEAICGVKARVISVLAEQWASGPTSLNVVMAQPNRDAFGHEWCRMMITLQAMQGIGKAGVNFSPTSSNGDAPVDPNQTFPPMYAVGGIEYLATKRSSNAVLQQLCILNFDQGILNPPVSWTVA